MNCKLFIICTFCLVLRIWSGLINAVYVCCILSRRTEMNERKFYDKNLHIKYIYVLLIALLYTYDLSMKCYSKSLICHDCLFSLLTILQSTNASKMSL